LGTGLNAESHQAVAPRNDDAAAAASLAFRDAGALWVQAEQSTEPTVLRRPGDEMIAAPRTEITFATPFLFRQPIDAPLGFTGPSGILPREPQVGPHFVPMEDRWRMGFPTWDRYGRGHPPVDDYPFALGRLVNPYTQNVLKGDYAILGQNTFLTVTATNDLIVESRQVPTATSPFESTSGAGQSDFFGNPNQFVINNFMSTTFDLSHGDAAFKPADWRIRLTPVFNMNYLSVQELGVVNPDVRAGTTRFDDFFSLQEWFVEAKLMDLSPDYDFASVRAGSQLFTSDFRGFVFSDINRAVRLFGTRLANRDQFNVLLLDQAEKDTNSGLNTFASRGQEILIANYYRQDFIFPGYTTQASFHYNHDQPSMHYDENGFLVRPDPTGVALPHQVDAAYLGWAGDGHINRLNITHQFYQVFGRDSLNPIGGQPMNISAQMAAVELSYDRDWAHFRSSFFYASGQHDITSRTAHGFDSILDNPNFAGGQFSFWQRQAIKLDGVNLVNRLSLLPDLRSSKLEGQSNFVNPGLELFNLGVDFDLTPKLRLVNNINFLQFDSTEVLRHFLFQNTIHRQIGTDLSSGVEYRPLLNNNILILAGISALVPGAGFKDIYNPIVGNVGTLVASFLDVAMTY
jgi:hypothetical protein